MALDILHDNWGPYTHTEVENALKAYLTVLENRINHAIQSGGVGLADLSAEVKALLNKANTALQPENIAAWAKAQNKPGYTVSEITGVEGFQNLLAKLQDMDQKIQEAAQSGVDPDDEMSSTSENVVQNKVIKAYVDAVSARIDTLIGSGNVQGAIDTFNEVVSFLAGISSSDTLAAKLAQLASDISGKVDKVIGKGLSTNDYTDADKTKLAGLSNDYEDLDNKPTIPDLSDYYDKAEVDTLIDESAGADGKSAYECYVETTSDDPVLTEAEWLASLKGPKGDTGNCTITGDGSNIVALIVNDLTTGGAGNMLSAQQGKVLDEKMQPLIETFLPTMTESYDQTDCTVSGKYVRYADGTLTSYTNFIATDFIEIPTGAKRYTYVDSFGASSSSSGMAFYDANKTYISGVKATKTQVSGDIPANAAYLRFTCTSTGTTTLVLTGGGYELWEKAFLQNIHDSLPNLDGVEELTENLLPALNATFDGSLCTDSGKIIKYSDGTVGSNSSFLVSDYVAIPQSAKQYTYVDTFGGSTSGLAFYDASKTFISGVKSTLTQVSGNIPTNAAFIRYTNMSGKTVTITMTGRGYAVWKETLDDEINDLVDSKIGWPYEYVKTIDNKDVVNRGGYIKRTTGEITSDGGYSYSDYIDIGNASSMKYTYSVDSVSNGLCFYDASKNYISGFALMNVSNAAVTIPSNAKYIRFGISNLNTIRIELSYDGYVGAEQAIDDLSNGQDLAGRKVLLCGNSFLGNGIEYLGQICTNLQLDKHCTIQAVKIDGSSLETWATGLSTSRTPINVYGVPIAGTSPMTTIFSKPWDIIVFQQVSDTADEYTTYNPHLSILIDKVRTLCPNKAVKIAFQAVWETFGSTSGSTYANIITAAKEMLGDYWKTIDILIPSGTAIENLRGTSLNTGHGFRYDDKHLSLGCGRYVVGCTLALALFGDILPSNKSIYDDTTADDVSGALSGQTTGAVAIDNTSRPVCQKAAMYAWIRPFGVTPAATLES